VLPCDTRIDEDALFHRALTVNSERIDYSVRPLAERLGILFGKSASNPTVLAGLTTAFLEPIFATAVAEPDALTILTSLHRQGFRTAIVSNTPWGSPARAWRGELARHGLLAAVDAAVFCTDVGYRKPHPAPFERALTLLGVPAGEAVFVGDDPCWDVGGATRAGVHPILLSAKPAAAITDPVPTARNLQQVLDYMIAVRALPRCPSMEATT
jgi:HAD superfamily hydrolase (TIGR01509 family)